MDVLNAINFDRAAPAESDPMVEYQSILKIGSARTASAVFASGGAGPQSGTEQFTRQKSRGQLPRRGTPATAVAKWLKSPHRGRRNTDRISRESAFRRGSNLEISICESMSEAGRILTTMSANVIPLARGQPDGRARVPARGKSGLREARVPGNARPGKPEGKRRRKQTAPLAGQG